MFVFETIILAYETYGNDRDGGACAHHPTAGHIQCRVVYYIYTIVLLKQRTCISFHMYIYIYIASHLLALFPKIGSMKKCSVFFSDFFKDNAASTRCELHIVKQLATASAPYKYKPPPAAVSRRQEMNSACIYLCEQAQWTTNVLWLYILSRCRVDSVTALRGFTVMQNVGCVFALLWREGVPRKIMWGILILGKALFGWTKKNWFPRSLGIMYFLHSVSVSGFNSLTRHGLSNKQCCNKAWKPMIYKVLHVSNCAGRSHLICWPWLSYVKFAQCAGVEKKK